MANFGETLRQARAHKGVTLKEAEQATRINRSHLAALEDENFRALPPLIYQRGIVRNYALYLDLEPTRVLSLFEDARGGDSDSSRQGIEAVPPINMPTHWAPNFAIIAFAVVLSAIVFAWTYSAFVQPTENGAESTQVVATVTPYASDIAMPTEPPATATPTQEPSPTATATSEPVERIDTGRDLPTVPADQGSDDTNTGSDNRLQDALQGNTSSDDASSQNEQVAQDELEQVIEDAGESPQTGQEQASQAENANNGAVIASIRVEAVDTITVSIVADGVSVYEGTLQPGEETQFFEGSLFEVYTSSGVNTMFTNGCGIEFQMGYEQGEVYYSMPAQPCS